MVLWGFRVFIMGAENKMARQLDGGKKREKLI